MFDIGFTEILLIGGVALVVVGPERLPETVRTAGLWIGRLKRSLRETRRELEEQLGADDIRRQLHNEDIMRSIEKVKADVSSTLNEQIDLDADLYPPGHHDHDPNNTIDEEPDPYVPPTAESLANNNLDNNINDNIISNNTHSDTHNNINPNANSAASVTKKTDNTTASASSNQTSDKQ